MSAKDPLLAPIAGAETRQFPNLRIDVGKAGACRVKRTVYEPGFKWSKDMKPIVGTEGCQYAHVGFLARGEVHIRYADGCMLKLKAPQVVAIEPGHDGWVVGDEPAVLIEFDFEKDTAKRMGMPEAHGRHSP